MFSMYIPIMKKLFKDHPWRMSFATLLMGAVAMLFGEISARSGILASDASVRNLTAITKDGIILSVLTLLLVVCDFTSGALHACANGMVLHALRLAVFRKVRKVPFSDYETGGGGRLVSLLQNVLALSTDGVTAVVFPLMYHVGLIVASLVVLIATIYTMGAWVIAIPLLIWIASYIPQRKAKLASASRQLYSNELSTLNVAVVDDALADKLKDQESPDDEFASQYQQASQGFQDQSYKVFIWTLLMGSIAKMLRSLSVVVFLWVIVPMLYTHSAGVLATALPALLQIPTSAEAIFALYERFAKVGNNLEEAYAAMGLPEEATPEPMPAGQFVQLNVQDVWYSIQNVSILKGITGLFEIGKAYVVLGHSAAGKSTLLKLIIGLLGPVNGTIEAVFESGKIEMKNARRSELVTYVPQAHQLKVNYITTPTLRDFLIQGLNIDDTVLMKFLQKALLLESFSAKGGLDLRTLEERVELALQLFLEEIDFWERIQMKGGLSRKMRGLSGGELQTVSIACSVFHLIVGRSVIFILDEPTTGLDPVFKKVVINALSWLRKRQRILFFLITHDLDIVPLFGHSSANGEVCYLEKGQILQSGPSDLLEKQEGPYHQLLALNATVESQKRALTTNRWNKAVMTIGRLLRAE